jgi:hypothetical protein
VARGDASDCVRAEPGSACGVHYGLGIIIALLLAILFVLIVRG